METTIITTTLELQNLARPHLRGSNGPGRRILLSDEEGVDLLVWLPIVVLLSLMAVFFLVMGIRYQIWQHTPHTITKGAISEQDEASAVETKKAPEQAPEQATHKETIHSKKLPADLVTILVEQQLHPVHREVSSQHRHIVDSIVRRYSNSQMKSDVEALEMFSLFPGLLESASAVLAATSLQDRGFPAAAMRLLVDQNSVEEVELKASLEATIAEEWKHSQGKLVLHYGKFWKGYELRAAVASCFQMLKDRVHVVAAASNHDQKFKFGIEGMTKDTHGPFSEEEQKKSSSLYSILTQHNAELPKIEDALKIQNQSDSVALFERRIFPGHSCKLPFVRFVKVNAILQMDTLTKSSDIPNGHFIKQGKFAVSFNLSSTEQADSSGDLLRRLKYILQNLEGVRSDDGVYIDWCCFDKDDPMKKLVTKSIFQHCHVIFLPDADFFLRPWCMYEHCTWLQSPFPNQAICDYDLTQAAIQMSSYFGRPPYLLDRPELQFFGYRCLASANDGDDKTFLSTKLVNESQVHQCSLEELLTKIIFKFESAVIV
jgi:hypothetical protein